LWLRHPSRYKGWRDFQRSGVHPIGRRRARAWFRNAGLSFERISTTIPKRWKSLAASTGGLADAFFSSEYTFVGRRTERKVKATVLSTPMRQFEIEPEMSSISDRGPNR